ncbi:hypothetical protein A3K01_00615 [candidate division WWE3 bacterium RIFOXYD1_FULL_43_17]|uniref:DUF5667 domain-containing protein n=1 Tax=candidate division WWE3 bacterium RIFOXYD1_FULL_43_17 TaxID=1802652 RepID=A0A1F4XEL1_UNCKA|nr:MAG: hypothetical protein A3K01_00615 [candidate division WWE3 bacterium RIFOXYD1_FULL_43_17]
MKINNLVKLTVIPALFILPLLLTSAQTVLPAREAKDLQNESLPKLDNPRVMEIKAANQERRCELATQRIAEKVSRYRNLEKRHQGVYLGLGNKLENLVSRLEADGYTGGNIEALKTDITQLNELAAKMKTSYTNYLSRLDELKTAGCTDSDVNFQEALKTAREELTASGAVIKEIKEFYLTEVKPDIAAMRTQIQEEKLGQQEGNETEDENTEEEKD